MPFVPLIARHAGAVHGQEGCGSIGRRCAAVAQRRFERLRLLRDREMLAHRRAGALRIVRPDGVVDGPVQMSRFLQIAPVLRRLAPLLVEQGGHHLHERRENRIARGFGHRTVEADVVDQEGLRIVERGKHAGDLLRDGGDLLVVRTFGGKTRHPHFERTPRLEHLVAREAVERGEKTQRLAAERRRAIGDEGAGAVPGLKDADRCKRTQTRARRLAG